MSNQKIAENQELDDLKKILSTEEGARFFWRLFEFCGLYRSPATGERQSTDINIGQNNVALWALGEALEAHPQAIARLIVKNQTMEHKND